jgi:multiple sugar transport system permease protein
MAARRAAGWGGINAIVVICALFPVFWLLMLSLKKPSTISDGRLIPSSWSFENYKGIFEQDVFNRALVNSIGIALISTVIAVIFASMAAYAIARLEFPGKRVILTASLAIAMFPPVALVGPLYNLWRNIGLYNTWPGLIIPYMTFTLPLGIYTLSAFFREIPWDLEQAAQVDGATPAQAFRFAFSLTSTTAAQTVPAAIALFPGASQFSQPTGSIAAAAMVVTIPIIVMVLFFQRRIVAGLTAGAVKG